MAGANMSDSLPRLKKINLIVVNVDVSSLLAAVALRCVVGKTNASYLFVRSGKWDDRSLSRHLARVERISALIGVHAIKDLVDILNSGSNEIEAIIDASSRVAWQRVLERKFDGLLVTPQNESDIYHGPGQVLYARFAQELEKEQKFLLFCELASQVDRGKSAGTTGMLGLFTRAAELSNYDSSTDGRLTHLIDRFSFYDSSDDAIDGWVGGS